MCAASGLASTTVHGRRAHHLEGDWCTFDSSPGVQRHPQVACCELRCHGVIPRTRRSTRSSALTVSLCEAVFSCPRPEGRACRRHRQSRHYKDPDVLVSINMSEMTGHQHGRACDALGKNNMEGCCFGGRGATTHNDALFTCHWRSRGGFRPSRRQQAVSALNLDTEVSLDPSGITNSGITRGRSQVVLPCSVKTCLARRVEVFHGIGRWRLE